MSRSGTNQSEDNSYDNVSYFFLALIVFFQEFRPIRLPDFQNTCGRLDPDYWNDILLKIEKENRDAIESEYTNFRMFMVPETVQLIFTICVRLELPHEVRYLALIIFDE
jgi:hypothetical protein